MNDEQEEQESLILATAKVEYLDPSMSKEPLCKFPDNGAFDNTQSSLWSPLVPRAYSVADLDLGPIITPRKLAFGLKLEKSKKSSANKFRPNIKNNIAPAAFNINLNLLRNRNNKSNAMTYEFSSTPVKGACAPIITKGWNKMLKAASKHFKREKKDPTIHVKLRNYLRD